MLSWVTASNNMADIIRSRPHNTELLQFCQGSFEPLMLGLFTISNSRKAVCQHQIQWQTKILYRATFFITPSKGMFPMRCKILALVGR